MKARSKSDGTRRRRHVEHPAAGQDAHDDSNSEPLVGAPGSASGEAPANAESSQDALLKLKIARAADVSSTLERLGKKVGLRDIEQLFPGETHPDLSKIYVAHVDAERMADVIPEVAADEDVEYVDGPAPRKLV